MRSSSSRAFARRLLHLRFGQCAQRRQLAEQRRAAQVHAHVIGEIGRAVGQVRRHLLYEVGAVANLCGPVETQFLFDGAEGRRTERASAQRTRAVRRKNFHATRQREHFVEQRIVKLAGQRGRVGVHVAQVGTAHVVHEEQVAGEHRHGLARFAHDEAQAVGRVTGRLQHFDYERAHADAVTVPRGNALVFHGCAVRSVNLRAGAGGQFREAAGEIRVRMGVENGGDFQTRAFGGGEVIVHVAFGVNDRRLAVRADQIGGVGESFDEIAFEIHGVSFCVG